MVIQVTSLYRQTDKTAVLHKNFPITCCECLACLFTWCKHDPLAGKYSTASPFIRGGATFKTSNSRNVQHFSGESRYRYVGWFAGHACKNVISVTPNCPNDRVLCIVYIQLTNVATSWKTWPTPQRSTLQVIAHYMIMFVCLQVSDLTLHGSLSWANNSLRTLMIYYLMLVFSNQGSARNVKKNT